MASEVHDRGGGWGEFDKRLKRRPKAKKARERR
jgi:hypothetical protein